MPVVLHHSGIGLASVVAACSLACGIAATPPAEPPVVVVAVPASSGTPSQVQPPYDPPPAPRPIDVRLRLERALDELQASHAAGMNRMGEDGFLPWQDELEKEFEVTMQPNACLSILAAAEGTDELELALVLRLPMPNAPMPDMVVAQDTLTGPRAVVGANGNCFRLPVPLPVALASRLKAHGRGGAVMWRVMQ
jgi:hypothetical protein